MKKQQNNPAKKRIEQKRETVAGQTTQKSGGKVKFLLKGLLMLSFVTAIVAYTDKKEYFVGDQTNNHTERKWRSFYRFADKQLKNADIVVFGNSHASAGVEPYIVSMATGTYCFILNTPGSSAIDAYFNLQEILAHNTKPKIVILETACLNGSEIGEEWGRIQSFEAKKNSWQKLKSMPYLFKPDKWIKAWSSTIRNHNFLLTDTARIAFNLKNVGKHKNPDKSSFDLGRFSHGQNFLKDTTVAKYTKLGSPIKCAKHDIADGNVIYLKKLHELCKENGIELMLFTAPMYYKTFDNYSVQKNKDLAAFKEIPNLKWLDLQESYDSALFTVEAFNNEYIGAQHNTYYGMTLNSYKLSKFILDNYANILPNKKNEQYWIDDFINTDFDFVFNHDVSPAMTAYVVVAKHQNIDELHVKEFVTKEDGNNKILILKLDNHTGLKDSVRAELEIEIQNQRAIVPVILSSRKDVFPPTHKVYLASLRKDIKVLNIQKIHL